MNKSNYEEFLIGLDWKPIFELMAEIRSSNDNYLQNSISDILCIIAKKTTEDELLKLMKTFLNNENFVFLKGLYEKQNRHLF